MKKGNRNKSIKIRLSDEEHELLMAKKDQAMLAKWMREFCIGQSGHGQSNHQSIDPILKEQIIRIGNNLNQIARSLNARTFRDAELPAMIMAIDKCKSLYDQIRADVTRSI